MSLCGIFYAIFTVSDVCISKIFATFFEWSILVMYIWNLWVLFYLSVLDSETENENLNI